MNTAYQSSYTGTQIDTAIAAALTAVGEDGIVSVEGLSTVLGDYLTTSDASSTYLAKAGGTITNDLTINGSLYLTRATDAEATADNRPALLIGPYDGAHLEFDGNEIMAKGSATTTSTLYLNNNGGNTQIGGSLSAAATITSATGLISTNGYIKSDNVLYFLTMSGAAQNGKFGHIGLSDSYSNGDLSTYRLDCYGGSMRIYNGYLRICGTTDATMSASSGNPRICFAESINTQPVYLVYTDYDSYRNPAGLKVVGGDNATPAWFEVEGAVYGRSWNATSSREIKHDIMNLNEVGEMLDNLTPVSFIYNDDKFNEKRFGLIYEDTVEICPDICKENGVSRTINYVDLVPILLREIQSLRARVKQLENSNI